MQEQPGIGYDKTKVKSSDNIEAKSDDKIEAECKQKLQEQEQPGTGHNKIDCNATNPLEDAEDKLSKGDTEGLGYLRRQNFGSMGFGSMDASSKDFIGRNFGSRGAGRPPDVEDKAEADKIYPNAIKPLEDAKAKLNEDDVVELEDLQRHNFRSMGFGGVAPVIRLVLMIH